VSPDEKRALGRQMLAAVEATWEHMEEVEPYDAPYYDAILRQGCEWYLAGQFSMPMDAISLAIALLTVARQAHIEAGGALPDNPYEQEPLS